MRLTKFTIELSIAIFSVLFLSFMKSNIFLPHDLNIPKIIPKRDVQLTSMSENDIQIQFFQIPSYFEKNLKKASLENEVKYFAKVEGCTYYFTSQEVKVVLPKTIENSNTVASSALKLQFIGSNQDLTVKGIKDNEIPNFSKLLYKNVYPGIDAIFYGNQKLLEYDLCVAPQRNPQDIRLHIDGAKKLSINASGDLIAHVENDQELQMQKPIVYQMIENGKIFIEGNFVLLAKNEFGFEIGNYNKELPLIIDPTVVYSTYAGGPTGTLNGIVSDSSGNVYITGTASNNFSTITPGAFQTQFGGGSFDACVTKFNSTGSALIFSTYIGGSANDTPNAIALDSSTGNVFITGGTNSANFPTSIGAFQTVKVSGAGGRDAFVTGLTSNGSSLVFSSFLGGTIDNEGLGIAVGSGSNIYVVGTTTSGNFPTTPGVVQPSNPGGGGTTAFVTQFNSSGSSLNYSTYLGGTGTDRGIAIALLGGDAFVTGNTNSTNFPTTSGAFQSFFGTGTLDAFVTHLNATATAPLVYSTYLGGSLSDFGTDISVNSLGQAYVVGQTNSTNFPTTSGAFQTAYGGGSSNGFITKLNTLGTGLVFSTYLGGSISDTVRQVALDSFDNIYVTGTSASANFPTTPGAFQSSLNGINDLIFTSFDSSGSFLLYSTFIGGSGTEFLGAINIDAFENIYIGAVTNSTNFPVTPGAYQTQFIPNQDPAVIKFANGPNVASISPTFGPSAGGTVVTIIGSGFVNVTSVEFGGSAAVFLVDSPTQITAASPPGVGVVDVTVTTVLGTSGITTADQFTYVPVPTVTSISPNFGPEAGGTSVTITGTGFINVSSVQFGASTATFIVNSSTQITATSPTGIGVVDVTVTNSTATSPTSSADQFTYIPFPVVTSISPNFGPEAGGTSVTITGTGFVNVTSVQFGASTATFIVNSSTQITATSPAGTGVVDVTVTNTTGTSATSAADQFTYIPLPVVTSISPNFGPAAGGTSVTITGTGFVNITSVQFGASTATFIVNSSTQITATSPAGTGVVDVTVTNSTGTSATSSADQFTYIPIPVVTSISPNFGPEAGGTSVTITGTGFLNVSSVQFGASTATFIVNSSTQITATSPAGTGVVDVTVTNSTATSATSAADQFTYIPLPVVTGISPNFGPEAGGTSVTITGTGFVNITSVQFGASTATFIVNSSTQITATSPAGTGVVDVTVTNSTGTSATSSADQFTYIPLPVVTNISPNFGPEAGGTSVTITGTGFVNITSVQFGASTATFIVNSSTQITATSPAGTGVVDVTVTNSTGTSAISAADQFTYIPLPVVTSISPNFGPEAGGTSVTITGTGFVNITSVQFGASTATFIVNSSTQITATSPAGTGVVDVTVTNSTGTSATSSADQFTYIPLPVVTSISPNFGPEAGGTSVTITGTGFVNITSVQFGASTATFIVNSSTQITATSPAGTGVVDVTVTNSTGTSAISAADQFTYIPLPVVTSISPNFGPEAGGTSVTITGTGFVNITSVQFGSSTATFIVNSSTQITATSPAGTGVVDVTVTNSTGTSATSAADQFTYIPLPVVTSISPNFGPAAGGTSVTITGTGFVNITSVQFGASTATFIVNSSTQITATSPAGMGVVDVTVTNSTGTSSTSSADQFTYIPIPVVTSISPNFGPESGGTSVTITGTGFLNVSSVQFGASTATFIVNSSTQITATSPPGVGVVDVTVTNSTATSATSAADQFTYIPLPVVTSISPNFGPEAGGTSVTITGTGFVNITSVQFGASTATFIVNSSTQITATSPAGTGVIDVTVTNSTGTSPTSSADQFTYIPLPVVTSISPNFGPAAGGTSVTITGTGFINVTSVQFGASTATFIVNSSTQITATSPAGTGVVDVTVTNSTGTSSTSSADQFTYIPIPVVTSISPNFGPEAGGTSVTITGTGFLNVSSVQFGASTATFIVNSSTQITATSPPGVGVVDVTVTNSTATSATSAADQFTYIPLPVVTSISPNFGPESGGTSVTITGTGFVNITSVKFGVTTATFIVNSSTQITATSPAGVGVVDVTVTNSTGTSSTSLSDQFTYIPPPIVTGLFPNSGSELGGNSVTITGNGFITVSAVLFGANPATFIVNSPTLITAISPPGLGTVDVTVTTSIGTSPITPNDEFTYQPPPFVTGISPTSGPASGGTVVTITGTGFINVIAVQFGSSFASFTVDSSTQITAISPPDAGFVNVTVTTTAGTSPETSSDLFNYIPSPFISTTLSVSPNPAALGQQVNLIAEVNPPSATGTVTFYDNSTSIGVVPLVNGRASLTVSFFTVGQHFLTAVYSGDGSFDSSTSPVVILTIETALSPSQLRGVQRENRFATQSDIINILTWNAPVQGTTPIEYRIYRNRNLTRLIGTVSANEKLQFEDHNRKQGKTYTYWVVSVDAFGNVSEPAVVRVH